MRPTCPECGEALSVGMEACFGCGAPLEGAEPATAPTHLVEEPAAAELPPPVVEQPPAAEPPVVDEPPVVAEPPRSRERRHEWIHILVVGLAAGIIVAGGLLALELVGPERLLIRDDELTQRSFPGLGFAVSHPVEWTVEAGRLRRLDAVSFADPERVTRRGFRVIVDGVSMQRVRGEVEALFRRERPGYRKLGITDELELAGRPALRHVFIDGPLVFEQWWVTRNGGTFRIEFWAPEGEREGANAENGRILETFRLV